MDIDTVIAQAEIRQKLACYSRGVDRLDRALIGSVFWEDAYDSHLSWEGTAPQFLEWVTTVTRDDIACRHVLHHSLIEVEGTTARAETYFTAQHLREVNGKEIASCTEGRYVDKFEKRGQEWRIILREVVADFRYHTDIHAGVPAGTFPMAPVNGRHSMDDPSYKLFKR